MADIVLRQHYEALGLPRPRVFPVEQPEGASSWRACRPVEQYSFLLLGLFLLWSRRPR